MFTLNTYLFPMDFSPSPDRLDKNIKEPGSRLDPAVRKQVKKLLKESTPISQIIDETGVASKTVAEIRKDLSDQGKLDYADFKRRTAQRLASFIGKGIERLDNEVDSMPIGQLPLATAIAIDKLEKLVDATPTVQVKAELRISADDINRMLFGGTVIDVTPENLPEEKMQKGD